LKKREKKKKGGEGGGGRHGSAQGREKGPRRSTCAVLSTPLRGKIKEKGKKRERRVGANSSSPSPPLFFKKRRGKGKKEGRERGKEGGMGYLRPVEQNIR